MIITPQGKTNINRFPPPQVKHFLYSSAFLHDIQIVNRTHSTKAAGAVAIGHPGGYFQGGMVTDNMPTVREDRLAAVFRDKPEMVVDLPAWMLSEGQADMYRALDDLAIVEIAGRDSVAAAVCAVRENGFGNLLPVYAYTGSEHGPWRSVEEAVNRLARRLPGARVHPLLVVGSPSFWHALNGRFVNDVMRVFGHYTPCTGCHLYLHAVRIPLSRMLGNAPIIAGERKSHSGEVKINQVDEALGFYVRFAGSFDVRLLLPLADIADGREIEEILGMPWQRGKEQLGCCLSGNYKQAMGGIGIGVDAVMRYFNEFAGPAARSMIAAYLENRVPDHEAAAKQAIAQCIGGE